MFFYIEIPHLSQVKGQPLAFCLGKFSCSPRANRSPNMKVRDRIEGYIQFWMTEKPKWLDQILPLIVVGLGCIGYLALQTREGKMFSFKNYSDFMAIVVFASIYLGLAGIILILESLKIWRSWSLERRIRRANATALSNAVQEAAKIGIKIDTEHQLVYLPHNARYLFSLVAPRLMGQLLASCALAANIKGLPFSWQMESLISDIQNVYRNQENTECCILGMSARHPEWREGSFRALHRHNDARRLYLEVT